MSKDTSLTAPTEVRPAEPDPSLGAEVEPAEPDRIARGQSVGRYIVLGELAAVGWASSIAPTIRSSTGSSR